MTGRLADRVAVITGAAAGTGKAAALRFAAEGAELALLDIDGEGLATTAAAVSDAGGVALAVTTDITDSGSVDSAFDQIAERFASVNVLFNCAGGSSLRDTVVTNLDFEVFDAAVNFNLRGLMLACRRGLPLLRAGGGGSVVNVSSAVALRGGIWPSDAYTAAKAGVVAVTRSMAANFAQYGIRVNVICPAMVRSERILKGNFGGTGVLDTGDVSALQVDFARYPFAAADPVDLANIALFLASDESRMITGATIPADGGMSAY